MNDKQLSKFIDDLPLDMKGLIGQIALAQARGSEYNERMRKTTLVPELHTAMVMPTSRTFHNKINFEAFNRQFEIIIDNDNFEISLHPLPKSASNLLYELGGNNIIDSFQSSESFKETDRDERLTYITDEMRYTLISALLTIVRRYALKSPRGVKIEHFKFVKDVSDLQATGPVSLVSYMKALKPAQATKKMSVEPLPKIIDDLPLNMKGHIGKIALAQAKGSEYNERMRKTTPIPELHTAVVMSTSSASIKRINFEAFNKQFVIYIHEDHNRFELRDIPYYSDLICSMMPPFIIDDSFQSVEDIDTDERYEHVSYITDEMRYMLMLALLTVMRRYRKDLSPENFQVRQLIAKRYPPSNSVVYLMRSLVPLIEYMKDIKPTSAQAGGDRSKIKFNGHIFKVRFDKNKLKYITCKEGRVLLKDIRGRYRYV
jgi:hypothetical protein